MVKVNLVEAFERLSATPVDFLLSDTLAIRDFKWQLVYLGPTRLIKTPKVVPENPRNLTKWAVVEYMFKYAAATPESIIETLGA